MNKKFWFYALWMPALCLFFVICSLITCYMFSFPPFPFICTILSVVMMIHAFIIIHHAYQRFLYYRTDFSPKAQLAWRQLKLSDIKLRKLYRLPQRKHLFKKPTGIVLGKRFKQYLCIPINPDNIFMGIIIGSPGSGKSSGPYISTLAHNFTLEHPIPSFVIDIKGELASHSLSPEDYEIVKVFNPNDPEHSAGWDVYYNISQFSTDDEVLDAIDKIARSLIVDTNPANAFFVNSARKILIGVLFYYFRKNVWTNPTTNKTCSGFIDAITEIMSTEPSELITKVLMDRAICDAHSCIDAHLGGFIGKESEALNGIMLQMSERIEVFSRQSIKTLLSPKHKVLASPFDLNEGTSIFLNIPEDKLSTMSTLFRLITFQTLTELEKRPTNSEPLLMLIDEFPRLGKIDKIKDTLTTVRSRKVSVWLAVQDLSQLQSVYGREGARSIVNLSEVTCVLSNRDLETCKMLSEWSGFYDEIKPSRTRNAITHMQSGIETISTERRPVIETSDIMRLRSEGGVMVWIEGIYCRAQRIRYFEDSYLSEIVKYNMNATHNYEQELKDNELLFSNVHTNNSNEISTSETISGYYQRFKK